MCDLAAPPVVPGYALRGIAQEEIDAFMRTLSRVIANLENDQ
ncbi:hypothetical protein [Nonomuraea basaltis]|nr:hypothetical protein [Nonomuraea basaltis]